MANYFYVKAGGALTVNDDTPYSSIQASSFSTLTTSNYYPDIYTAVTAGTKTSPATSGDYILCSDLHSTSTTFAGSISIPAGVYVISVDDSNGSLYKPGATENDTGTSNQYYLNNGVLVAGLDLENGDNVLRLPDGVTESAARVIDTKLRVDTTNDIAYYSNVDGCRITLVNVDIFGNSSTAYGFYVVGGGHLEWQGGSISTITDLFFEFGASGGATAIITGVDLSSITTLIPSYASSRDETLLRLNHCKINGSVTLPSGYLKYGQRFEMYNCDNGTDDKLYRFYIADYSGTAFNNDSTYVTTTESWYDGSDKSSIEVTTTANCTKAFPLVFELPAQYVDLATNSTITIELVYDATEITLDRESIAAFLCYPDGTTAVQANWITSGSTVGTGNYGIDPLGSGTALHTSSLTTGSWTGLSGMTTATVGALELNTSGDAGQATIASVRIEVYEPNIESGELFIHTLMGVS